MARKKKKPLPEKRMELKPSTASKRKPSSKANTTSTASRSKSTRIERPFRLPGYVREALRALWDAGHVAYVVGGSVRDQLLGREGKDHDIATDAPPECLAELFPTAIEVGRSFGVFKVPLQGEASEFLEITAFREDLEYADYRHPRRVRFASVVEDAARRDFTVNALYYDAKEGKVLDFHFGMEDMQARVLRAIGKPEDRFREDALRLLRGARFAANLGFEIEEKTDSAIRARAKLIQRVSGERVRDELTQCWQGRDPAAALQILAELELLGFVLPEVHALTATAGYFEKARRFLRVLHKLYPKRGFEISWAGALWEIGRPIADRKAQRDPEPEAEAASRAVSERLRFSAEQTERVARLLGERQRLRDVFRMREATLIRLLREPDFEDMLALHHVECVATDGNVATYDFWRSRYRADLEIRARESSPRLIDGNDLIQLGLRPGKEFAEILRAVEDLSLERKLTSKEQALEYVLQRFIR